MEKMVQPLMHLWRDATIALTIWVLLAYLLDLVLSGFVQMLFPLAGITLAAGINLLAWAVVQSRQRHRNVLK